MQVFRVLIISYLKLMDRFFHQNGGVKYLEKLSMTSVWQEIIFVVQTFQNESRTSYENSTRQFIHCTFFPTIIQH
jgi:hypothetical protein